MPHALGDQQHECGKQHEQAIKRRHDFDNKTERRRCNYNKKAFIEALDLSIVYDALEGDQSAVMLLTQLDRLARLKLRSLYALVMKETLECQQGSLGIAV